MFADWIGIRNIIPHPSSSQWNVKPHSMEGEGLNKTLIHIYFIFNIFLMLYISIKHNVDLITFVFTSTYFSVLLSFNIYCLLYQQKIKKNTLFKGVISAYFTKLTVMHEINTKYS